MSNYLKISPKYQLQLMLAAFQLIRSASFGSHGERMKVLVFLLGK